jgi:flavin-dependent dehydrogenase
MLANPLCYGGIGAALLSGRKAAEGIARGDLSGYAAWVRKDRMFDPHFMDALETFKGWDEKDYADAVKPFRKGYSLIRGAYAMLRRPRWANVYMSIWMAFRKGW